MTLIDLVVEAILNLLSTITPCNDSALFLRIQPSARLINVNTNKSSISINSDTVQSPQILSCLFVIHMNTAHFNVEQCPLWSRAVFLFCSVWTV